MTVHDSPFKCKDDLKLCLSFKPPRQNLSLSVSTVCSNSLSSSSSQILKNNLIEVSYPIIQLLNICFYRKQYLSIEGSGFVIK